MNFTFQVSDIHMQIIWDHLYKGVAADVFPVLETLKAQIMQQEQAVAEQQQAEAEASIRAKLEAEKPAVQALPPIDGGAGGQG